MGLNYFAYTIGMLWVGRKLIGFRWTAGVVHLIASSAVVITVAAIAALSFSSTTRYITGIALTAIATVVTLRGLVQRLGREHRLVSAIVRIPGASLLLKTSDYKKQDPV
jgi:Kef-type K+ transport system membrane component KefB